MGNEKLFSSLALDHFVITILSQGSDNPNWFYFFEELERGKKFNTMTFKLEVLGKDYKLRVLITFK